MEKRAHRARHHDTTDDGTAHKYFSMIPHTVVRGNKGQGISLPARWLYVYLKSIAGEYGECTRSTSTIAKEAQLGRGTIFNAKQELVTHGLIIMTTRRDGHHDTDRIRIVDLWPENMREFAKEGCSPHEQLDVGCSPHEQPISAEESTKSDLDCSPDEQCGCSPDELKKIDLKTKILRKEKERETSAPEAPSADVVSSIKIPYSVGFEKFWQVYPVKKDKNAAWKIWQRQKLEALAETICASVPLHQLHDEAWQKGFIKYPATYLNAACWEDDLSSKPTVPPRKERLIL